jgi:AcrR family transcriptional regulator
MLTRILDAVVESLIERGYAATTVAEVQHRAGIARGTLLHHFPHRIQMMAAAVEHIAEQRLVYFGRSAELEYTGASGVDRMVETIWSDVSGREFFAMLELWVAARTDDDLRSALLPLERRLFSVVAQAYAGNATGDLAERRLPTLAEFSVNFLAGVSLASMLTGPSGARETQIRRWKRALRVMQGELEPEELDGRAGPRQDGPERGR